jgi:hypothetical protein
MSEELWCQLIPSAPEEEQKPPKKVPRPREPGHEPYGSFKAAAGWIAWSHESRPQGVGDPAVLLGNTGPNTGGAAGQASAPRLPFTFRHWSLLGVLTAERPDLASAFALERRAIGESPAFVIEVWCLLSASARVLPGGIDSCAIGIDRGTRGRSHDRGRLGGLGCSTRCEGSESGPPSLVNRSRQRPARPHGAVQQYRVDRRSRRRNAGVAPYLWASAHILTGSPHMNEVFSARRIKDCKHVIRFHLQCGGALKAYVLAVVRVTRFRQWTAVGNPNGPLYVPRVQPAVHIADEFDV